MINLKGVSTLDLVKELKTRDFLAELSEEKKEWLKRNGFYPINDLQFIALHRVGNQGYGLEHLINHSLEEIVQGDKKLRAKIEKPERSTK
ncbi:MAG: hypothetical protein WBH77_10030 [Saccharofermentanales bacterium]